MCFGEGKLSPRCEGGVWITMENEWISVDNSVDKSENRKKGGFMNKRCG